MQRSMARNFENLLMSSLCFCTSSAKGVSALQGMAYLHANNIVHYDLKSANLLLGYCDRRAVCKVADFGLFKQKCDTYVGNVTSLRGTLPWVAPKIIKTTEYVTERVRLRGPYAAAAFLAHAVPMRVRM